MLVVWRRWTVAWWTSAAESAPSESGPAPSFRILGIATEVMDVHDGELLPTLDEAIKSALAARPELAQSAISITSNQLDTRLSREQAKPQIDAFANVSVTGLAGHPLPPCGRPDASSLHGITNRMPG